MTRWSEGLGRTIIIAAVAGGLFAGFLALAPRLTAAETETAPTTTVPLAATSALPGISDPVLAVPADSADVEVTVTTDPVPTTAVTVPITDSPTTTLAPDPAFDGSIELTVDARPAGEADVDGILVEGDELQWRFTLANVSDEELWGAYVYLELHGPVWCEEHHLDPGQATDCWIATTALEGTHTAEAWATAWTTDRIVKASLDYTFTVSL